MDFSKAPKASQVIDALKDLIEKHGDLPVCAEDADSSLRLRIGIVYEPRDLENILPPRFEIKTDYHGKPEGVILSAEKEEQKENQEWKPRTLLTFKVSALWD